ncbi:MULTISPECIES: hypothetical protein [Rhodococcus]|uniref:Uncharacterized protein n=1 Tax=Rhodococcus cerastii TaxID=908616 RepID=A0ABU4D2Z2_9NOCA|nr:MULTISPECIES: hypothetical protein [Rhodococcus]MDV6303722.1 hypothetical protein [Rhodococcus cerastii]MDV8058267.1 hypothetical protein [Rhodococcus sp. IEGM 1343]
MTGGGVDIIWPDHYPDQCPPADAARAVGLYFRLVDAAPPTGEDTLSHVELKRAGARFKNKDFGDQECMASGFSVFDEQLAAERTREAVGPLRKKLIAKVDVSGSGVLKQTGGNQNHHTWWRPAADNDWGNCEVVA